MAIRLEHVLTGTDFQPSSFLAPCWYRRYSSVIMIVETTTRDRDDVNRKMWHAGGCDE